MTVSPRFPTLALPYDAAAAAVGVSRRTLERAVAAGQLRAVAISPRRRVVPIGELESWLVARTLQRTVTGRGGASR